MLESPTNFDFNQSQTKENLIFIDSAIENYQGLMNIAAPNSEIILLNSSQNGIEQISDHLAQYQNIDSVQIFSHGQVGSIQLGNSQLNIDNIQFYDDQIKTWGNALSNEGDILFYGCNVAASLEGKNLIQDLAGLTNADIAASNDLTGNNALGGDWDLELQTGTIETDSLLPVEVNKIFDGVLHGDDALISEEDATHVAIKSGSWFDPTIWKDGKLPIDGAQVFIPKDIRVNYNQQSDTRLYTLRVDGNLSFATGTNTKMLVDTLFVASEGKLFIGQENNPIQANRTAQIIFTSDKAINTQWDTEQLSRGLISQGNVQIYGADKLDFVALKSDVFKGDKELILDLPTGTTTPQGWQVGDQLVLGGTYYTGKGSDENNSKFHDEELTITAINGNRISFTNNDISSGDNTVLRFNHERPDEFENRLNLYVANTTRNIIFETENGETAPIARRGHVMFMHNPDVVVKNAGFYNLGRTDKNKLIDDVDLNRDGSIGYGTNPRARYSVHFHHTGTDNPNGTPAIAKGNAIVGSPGWGLVQHQSYAVLEDNVVFDVVGSGIVAEAGNEIGAWRNNITIKTTGDDQLTPDLGPTSRRVKRFDFGFNGESYWVQGAGQIAMIDNIAISAAEAGLIHYGGGDGGQKARDAQNIAVANLPSQWQSIAKGTENESVVDVSAVPLRQLSGFQTYNSKRGIGFWAAMKNLDAQLELEGTLPSQITGHNFYSKVEDFTVWNVRDTGVSFMYSSQIELNKGLILSNSDLGYTARAGISGNSGANKNQFKNLEISGFQTGLNIPLDSDRDYAGSLLINSTFTNNTQNLATRRFNNGTPTGYPSYFQIIDTTFDIPQNNILPTAKFSTQAIGGLAVKFDATASIDNDSSEKNLVGKGITSYGWDFDNDGAIDQFGRQVSHYFERAGSYQVNLTVWDNQGATNTITQKIDVSSQAYSNLITDSSFSSAYKFGNILNATGADRGWMALNNWSRNYGQAVVSGGSGAAIGQVVFDNSIRRGQQTLSIDLKNTEGNRDPNQITVSVWGVNGEFYNPDWTVEGPQQLGAISMTKTKLLNQTIGGSTFNWKTFDWNLDFGNGYQFIVFQVNTSKIALNGGDYIAIDNVVIN